MLSDQFILRLYKQGIDTKPRNESKFDAILLQKSFK